MMPASSLSSYGTSNTDRWEPNKSPIIGLEALLRRGINTPTASNQNHIYKALALAAQGTYTDTLRKYLLLSSLANCFFVLTLASKALWQAPHR